MAENTLLILGLVFLVARLVHYVTIVFRLSPVFIHPLLMISTLGVILVSAIFPFVTKTLVSVSETVPTERNYML